MSSTARPGIARAGLLAAAIAAICAIPAFAAAGTALAAPLPTLTLAASPSGITASGLEVSGAVNVVATASGLKEPSIILFALKPGSNAGELISYLEQQHNDPNAAGKFGSIVVDEEGAPGKGSEAQTVLTPGNYVALVIEGEGKLKAHTAFTVAAAPSPAALPAAEATEKTIDFRFRGPSALHDGELVRFENEGFLVHMDIAFPVRSKAAGKKLIKDLLTGSERQERKLIAGPPITFAGPLSSGSFQQETITAKPGFYVQACFMQTQDGIDHTRLGMERLIGIAK
ncbi:MAG TPA: hypothetical protein VHT27_11345 [Solirubrobacteraceae bacterium]|nr:hypothetical protein [Solirubrobacteraceae bacterium]